MVNENNEFDVDSQNDVQEDVVANENDDTDALREKLTKVSEQNKQLYSRTKKAEGFVLKDGEWVKPEPKETKEPKAEPKNDAQPPKEPSESDELTDGQIAILRTEGIKSKDELALFKEIQAETGKGVMDLLDSNYFQSRLTEFRDTKESTDAVPKGKGRSGQTGVTDTDVALAKYKETGELPSDFKTRSEVVKVLEKEEESSGMFEGPSVVGPRNQ